MATSFCSAYESHGYYSSCCSGRAALNVGFFLKDRIEFIKQFYEAASLPFAEKKHKIEAEEEPFVPPYSEDAEPHFLNEPKGVTLDTRQK